MTATIEIGEVDALVRQGATLIPQDGASIITIDCQPEALTVICFCGEPVDAIDPTGWVCPLGHGEGMA